MCLCVTKGVCCLSSKKGEEEKENNNQPLTQWVFKAVKLLPNALMSTRWSGHF